jgi:hypothetical protein
MNRVRWFETVWPYSMRTLAARLKGYTFGAESSDGFLVERVRDTYIEGRHIEKVVFDEVVHDPFGNETTFNRFSYRQVEFVFSAAYPHVELRNAPRGLQTFISRTSEATDFAIAFVPIDIDTFKWADSIRSLFPKHFRIDLAQLSEVFIEEDVTAKMVLTSPQDIRAAFARFANRRKHTVERIQIKLDQDERPLSIQLATDGTLRTADTVPKEVLDAIRGALPASRTQA